MWEPVADSGGVGTSFQSGVWVQVAGTHVLRKAASGQMTTPLSTQSTVETAAGQPAAAAALMHLLVHERLQAERRQASGEATPAAPATSATAAEDHGQYSRVRFLQDSAEFEWTPHCDRIPEQTWIKVNVKEDEGEGASDDVDASLKAVKPWKSTEFVELKRVTGVGKMCVENVTIRLRYWDKAVTPMFRGLDDYVKQRDVQLRLEVIGAIGEDTLGYSRWISASQLVAAAAQNRPPVTEEMLAAQRQQRVEKERKKQQLLARREQEEKVKIEKKRRDEERRVAREAEKKKRDEEDARAEAAWQAEGWKKFSPCDESPACLRALRADFEGWYVRTARRTDEAGGKRMIYRTRREDSAQELWFDNEAELNIALLQLCRLHPVHCQVRVSPTLRPDFEGGLCTVNSREDATGCVRVKSAVGASAKIPRRDIEDWNAGDHIYGVNSLKLYWKKLTSRPFPVWRQTLTSVPLSGGEDQTPTPDTTAESREGRATSEPITRGAEEDRRESYPAEDPSEPVLNVKPERPQHVLLAGQPLKEAEANMGTLRNKKVFIGDSNIVGAGKGLFVAQVCIPGEVITRFDGEPGMMTDFVQRKVQKSHVITLEGGTSGRHLDCYGICSQFTAASKLKSPVGSYEAGRNSYYPVTDRYNNESLHDVGLAAFANSCTETTFGANARVEKTKYIPKGRDGEASGFLPFAFLIATKHLQPGDEVLFEYEVVVDEEPSAGAFAFATEGEDATNDKQQQVSMVCADVGGTKRQRESSSVAANPCAKRQAIMPPLQHAHAAASDTGSASASFNAAAASSTSSASHSSDGLAELLESIGLAHLGPTFANQDVDLVALRLMQNEDYDALGVKIGPRLKIKNALRALA